MKYVIGVLAVFSLLYFSRGFAVSLHVKLADKVSHQTIRRLASEKKLCCVGTGGGAMGLVQRLSLDFYYYQPVSSIDEARRLLLYATEAYRKDLNSSKELRPYLIAYPFPPHRIAINISFFKGKTLERVDVGQLRGASAYHGFVYYYIEKEQAERELVYQETYEEALDILHKEKTAMLGGSHEK